MLDMIVELVGGIASSIPAKVWIAILGAVVIIAVVMALVNGASVQA